MKVTRQSPPKVFYPITITLETVNDVLKLDAILAGFQDSLRLIADSVTAYHGIELDDLLQMSAQLRRGLDS